MYKILILLLAFTAFTTNGANLIQNPGFESSAVAPGTFVNLTNNLTSWRIQGNIDLVNGAGFSGLPGTNSSKFVDLNGIGAGSLQQTVAVVAGQSYSLSFRYALNDLAGTEIMEAQHYGGGFGGAMVNLIYRRSAPTAGESSYYYYWGADVSAPDRMSDTNGMSVTLPSTFVNGILWNSEIVSYWYPLVGHAVAASLMPSLGGSNYWHNYSAEFTVPAGASFATIAFLGDMGHQKSGGVMIDDVSVTLVP